MTAWTSRRVADVLGTPKVADRQFAAVGTDTRTLVRGALFVALVGERFDGHDFLEEAIAHGATGLVVRNGAAVPPQAVVFEVPDTLAALGALAHARRAEISGPVVAVTGTNGKTATKELLARAVGVRWRVHATSGNRNNLVGVPLTILDAPAETEALVIEAGASIPGEIAKLRAVVDPAIGVVTNVSAGHLQGFGSEEQILTEKLSLLEGVNIGVVGTRPPALAVRARQMAGHVHVAGVGATADVSPTSWRLDVDGRVIIEFDGTTVHLPLVGRHQVENAMLAFAVARELDLDSIAVGEAMQSVTLPPGRCEVLREGELVVLHDAYNANPASIASSLETAEAMRGDRPLVVVLGTMLELGERSAALHRSTAEHVLRMEPSLVAVTGAFIPAFAPFKDALGPRLLTADDPRTLGERLALRLEGREFVLLKASRGVRLETVIPHLITRGDF